MDNKNDKAQKGLEQLEKVGKVVDKSVKLTDEKLSAVPGMLGEYKGMVIITAIIVLVWALVSNPHLVFVGLAVVAVLNLSKITALLKKNMKKKDVADTATKAPAETEAKVVEAVQVKEKDVK